MQRVKLLGLALIAVFAMSAVVAGTAFGAIELLNKEKVAASNITFSGLSTIKTEFSILNGFAVTTCPEVETEGAQEGSSLWGSLHLHWSKCTTNLGGTCTGLNDTPGSILALVKWHLVEDKLLAEGSLGAGILFEVEHLHYECSGGFVPKTLVLVKGEVLCLISPLTLGTRLTIKCEKGRERGDPGETVYWNESGTKVEMGESGLLASENEGTFRMSAQEGSGESTTNQEVEIMD